jgi:dephospho-CoA kinase
VPRSNPAALCAPHPGWAARAEQCLEQVRTALHDLDGSGEAAFDHIGSTSVPGLAAKPFLDLQVRILPLPGHGDLARRLEPLGFDRARGARPDSPGVARDIPRGDEGVADHVWEKRLYFDRRRSVILHIRRADSPWGHYTVWFRDWLRAHPDARQRYEDTKRRLSEQNAGKDDYDDYTRAKSAFFDEVHPAFAAWAQRARGSG